MRQFLTITLLLIHAFNTAGYNLLFHYFISQSDTKLVQQLDRSQYNDDELIVLKTPINLPYYHSSGNVERIDGKIEIAGVHYNYVKRKISNDTLYLYCIPNTEKTKLNTAKNNLAKSAGDAVPDTQKGGNSLLKKMNWGVEYSTALMPFLFPSAHTLSAQQAMFLLPANTSPVVPSPTQPPDLS